MVKNHFKKLDDPPSTGDPDFFRNLYHDCKEIEFQKFPKIWKPYPDNFAPVLQIMQFVFSREKKRIFREYVAQLGPL